MPNRIRKFRYNRLIRKGQEYMKDADKKRFGTHYYYCTELALKYFTRAASLFSSRDEAPEAYDTAAECCCILGDYSLSEARSWFKDIVKISKAYEEAYTYFCRAEQYGRSVGNKRLICLIELAENEVKRRNYDKAEQLFCDAAKQSDTADTQERLHHCLYLHRLDEANEKRKAGDYKEALRLYGEALDNLSLIHAKDRDKVELYRHAEKCCLALGDEDGANRYADLYTPLLPLIDRIGGVNAWIRREDLLPEFMHRAQDALDSGDRKLAAEYCEEAIRLYLGRESSKVLSDTWEPDEIYYDIFSLLMHSKKKGGGVELTDYCRETVAQGISCTNNFAVKRRLYELWSANLEAENTDALKCLRSCVYSDKIEVGSTVLFGTYPQEDASAEQALPIEWEVLHVSNCELVLVSRYALDAVPCQTDGKNVPWEETTLYRWLNGEFLNRAFSEDERERIADGEIDCLSFGDLWKYYDNSRYGRLGTCGEDETIFSHLMVADGTPYALAKGLCRWQFYDEADFEIHDSIWCEDEDKTDSLHFNSADRNELYGRSGVCWWLKADEDFTGRFVTQDGVADKELHSAETAARKDIGVRPVILFWA